MAMAERDAPTWADPARLLRALGHAVITTDLRGRIVGWNPAAEQLYGWTADEVLGRDIQDVTVPESGRELAAEVMAALRAGRSWSGGFTVRRKDGTTFPALVTDAGVSDDSGQLVGIVGVSTDLGHALRPLLARSSDAAVVLGDGGALSFISPAALRLFGWSEERLVGCPLWELAHPDDRRMVEAHVRELPRSGGRAEMIEFRLSDGDGGDFRWVEALLTDLLDDPAVRGVVCNLRDVTARRRDRDRLADLTQQLQLALTTRVVIEQAKGMVAAQRGIGVEEAFDVLRRHARDHNATLQAVASAVVTLGLRP